MLRNRKGFFLVELLLSLSIWMLITLSLLPLYHHVSKQSISMQREIDATHIMYEVLQLSLLEGKFENSEVVRGNQPFLVVWEKEFNGFPTEVCINYEDAFQQTRQKCEWIQQ